MSPTEPQRLRLLQILEELLGPEEAQTLMASLPPDDWNALVRKDDLEPFATKQDLERFATKQDLERFATKQDLEHFPTKQDLERFATKEDLVRLEARVNGLRDAILSETRLDLVQQTRTLLLGQFGSAVTIGALLVAAVRL
ncbi:MAG TPA: hypothetical protein VGA36_05285 [Nitriliruptorales bacterium]